MKKRQNVHIPMTNACQNGFGAAQLHSLQWLVNGEANTVVHVAEKSVLNMI